jgi:hypothetical protein
MLYVPQNHVHCKIWGMKLKLRAPLFHYQQCVVRRYKQRIAAGGGHFKHL